MRTATSTTLASLPDLDQGTSFRAMACAIEVQVPAGVSRSLLGEVRRLFARVEAECTRFEPTSDLMRANAAGAEGWTEIGEFCFAAVAAAEQAHLATGGRFDPRVLATLRRLGYDRSFPGAEDQPLVGDVAGCREIEGRWQPELDPAGRRVRLGPDPIDLGGIGKGLAVRWAAELLSTEVADFLVEAGGDCYLAGDGPAAPGWQVGIEDPAGGPEPVAVLSVRNLAVATSSTRLRRWRAGATEVHHLIDPGTGQPAQGPLASVTVLGPDPAWAEVWSKTLFIAGAARIAELAEHHSLAAIWTVHDPLGSDVSIGASAAAEASILWRSR